MRCGWWGEVRADVEWMREGRGRMVSSCPFYAIQNIEDLQPYAVLGPCQHTVFVVLPPTGTHEPSPSLLRTVRIIHVTHDFFHIPYERFVQNSTIPDIPKYVPFQIIGMAGMFVRTDLVTLQTSMIIATLT